MGALLSAKFGQLAYLTGAANKPQHIGHLLGCFLRNLGDSSAQKIRARCSVVPDVFETSFRNGGGEAKIGRAIFFKFPAVSSPFSRPTLVTFYDFSEKCIYSVSKFAHLLTKV